MVELMPERDIDGQGALLAAQILASVLGVIARQRA
jgi:agmatinase